MLSSICTTATSFTTLPRQVAISDHHLQHHHHHHDQQQLQQVLHLQQNQHGSLTSKQGLHSSRRSFKCTVVPRLVVCEIAVQLNNDGSASATEEDGDGSLSVGSRIRVKGPLTVYHVPKNPNFELGGCEGVIKDVLKTWKGKPISANLPYKVQFELEIEGKKVKFFAHLKPDEFEVI